jgi:hypothetical protein
MPGTSKFSGSITAADTTGPARGPLPASSTPAITLYPLNMACFSKVNMSAGALPQVSGKAFFFDSCSFATQISQIVKFGSSYTAPGHHFNFVNGRRIQGEDSFNTYAAGNFSNGKAGTGKAFGFFDNHALENLDTLLFTFPDFYMNLYGIPGVEIRDIKAHLFSFNFLD